jgi:hypothetical protein
MKYLKLNWPAMAKTKKEKYFQINKTNGAIGPVEGK